ncbi:MAG: hypothetical protein RL291_2104 [Pseudomonadota bacterium]|jgi:DNA-binding transcriptional LysR family regulator
MRLDMLGLEAFVAVAERSSFQRAATHLGLTQTALSHRVKKLEAGLGTALLARTTRRVMLTADGLDLLPKAQALLSDANRILAEARVDQKSRRRQIAIGCLPTLAVTILPVVLGRFVTRHPQSTVRVFDNSATEVQDLVVKGQVEFAITSAGPQRTGLDFTPLGDEAYALLCPKAHRLAQKRFVKWVDLADTPLVRISTRTGNRRLMDAALGSDADRFRWAIEVQHIASAVAFVLGGVALAVVPRMALDPARMTGLALVPLREPTVARTIGSLTRTGHTLSPDAAGLLQDIAVEVRARVK